MEIVGKILLMPKGDYSATATYNALDWVRHNKKAWVCKINGTVGITPVEGANWTVLASDGIGDSVTAVHSKDGLITTVSILNSSTGEVVDFFEISDGEDGKDGRGLESITSVDEGKNHDLYANYTDGTSDLITTVRDGADGSGGGGGTSNYEDLSNLPKINNVVLSGNRSSSDLGLASETDIPIKTSDLTNDGDGEKPFLTEHQSLDGYAKTEDVPTKVSDLTNDSKFVTEAAIEKLDLTSEAQKDEALVWDSEVQKYMPKKTKGGHDMYKSLSELPKDEDGFIDVPSDDEHVMSAHAVFEVANTKIYMITVEAKLGDGNNRGIGTWCEDVDNYNPLVDSVDWIGARADHPEDADISNFLKTLNGKDNVVFTPVFDTETNEPVYCGGYQVDLTYGRFCIKFGNEITKDAIVGFEVKVVTKAN